MTTDGPGGNALATALISHAAARTLASYWLDEDDADAPSSVLARTGAISSETIRRPARDLELLELAGGPDSRGAFAQLQLRALLDYVRGHGPRGPLAGWAELPHDDPSAPAPPSAPAGRPMVGSLYDRVGGEPAMAEVVEAFSQRLLTDRMLAGHFEGVDVQRVRLHQGALLDALTGCPDAYEGRPLRRAHRGLGITDQQFDRAVDHLAASLANAGADGRVVGAVAGIVDGLRGQIVEAQRAWSPPAS